ncbi:MAG TPA: endonuclease III [Planctomycetota bacterium]|jgi:endonuclease-3
MSRTKSKPQCKRPFLKSILAVHARLRKRFGARPWLADREPVLDSLVGTILSQNTSDVNSSRAFAQFKKAFPDGEAARRASAAEIEEQIRSGGLAKTKSIRIKKILDYVYARRGQTSLDYLRRLTTERIKEDLSEFPGVGPKTIACVLMFNLKRPDFPVDTHIHRIAGRLDWVSSRASAEQTYEILNAIVPDRLTYELHVLLITLGRRICHARKPECLECPLFWTCPLAKRKRAQHAEF